MVQLGPLIGKFLFLGFVFRLEVFDVLESGVVFLDDVFFVELHLTEFVNGLLEILLGDVELVFQHLDTVLGFISLVDSYLHGVFLAKEIILEILKLSLGLFQVLLCLN